MDELHKYPNSLNFYSCTFEDFGLLLIVLYFIYIFMIRQ